MINTFNFFGSLDSDGNGKVDNGIEAKSFMFVRVKGSVGNEWGSEFM